MDAKVEVDGLQEAGVYADDEGRVVGEARHYFEQYLYDFLNDSSQTSISLTFTRE